MAMVLSYSFCFWSWFRLFRTVLTGSNLSLFKYHPIAPPAAAPENVDHKTTYWWVKSFKFKTTFGPLSQSWIYGVLPYLEMSATCMNKCILYCVQCRNCEHVAFQYMTSISVTQVKRSKCFCLKPPLELNNKTLNINWEKSLQSVRFARVIASNMITWKVTTIENKVPSNLGIGLNFSKILSLEIVTADI